MQGGLIINQMKAYSVILLNIYCLPEQHFIKTFCFCHELKHHFSMHCSLVAPPIFVTIYYSHDFIRITPGGAGSRHIVVILDWIGLNSMATQRSDLGNSTYND